MKNLRRIGRIREKLKREESNNCTNSTACLIANVLKISLLKPNFLLCSQVFLLLLLNIIFTVGARSKRRKRGTFFKAITKTLF